MSFDKNLYHILIVDDDRKIRDLLFKFLKKHNFYISMAENADDAREFLKRFKFDLIISDVMMPGENGVDFVKNLRCQKPEQPVIMLTAVSDVDGRINGLEAGADDYLCKPFEPKELLLRIHNVLKRVPLTSNLLKFGNYEFDFKSNNLYKENELIFLTSTELALMRHLCENFGNALEREKIAHKFDFASERTVDVQINRLRYKIEKNPKKPAHLKNVRNVGYVLE